MIIPNLKSIRKRKKSLTLMLTLPEKNSTVSGVCVRLHINEEGNVKRECVRLLRIKTHKNTHSKVQTPDFLFYYNSATCYIELNWHLLTYLSYQVSSKSDVMVP